MAPDIGEGGWCGDDRSRELRGKVAAEGLSGGSRVWRYGVLVIK